MKIEVLLLSMTLDYLILKTNYMKTKDYLAKFLSGESLKDTLEYSGKKIRTNNLRNSYDEQLTVHSEDVNAIVELINDKDFKFIDFALVCKNIEELDFSKKKYKFFKIYLRCISLIKLVLPKTDRLMLNGVGLKQIDCIDITNIHINNSELEILNVENPTEDLRWFTIMSNEKLKEINIKGAKIIPHINVQFNTSLGYSTSDPNYFFMKEHLRKDSDLRGEASIMDTGLFDFKINNK